MSHGAPCCDSVHRERRHLFLGLLALVTAASGAVNEQHLEHLSLGLVQGAVAVEEVVVDLHPELVVQYHCPRDESHRRPVGGIYVRQLGEVVLPYREVLYAPVSLVRPFGAIFVVQQPLEAVRGAVAVVVVASGRTGDHGPVHAHHWPVIMVELDHDHR